MSLAIVRRLNVGYAACGSTPKICENFALLCTFRRNEKCSRHKLCQLSLAIATNTNLHQPLLMFH
nr:MAG TPA: hypothetical protein [Microviridae sp.]